MSLPELHARFANTAILYFIFMGIWGYYRFFRKEGLNDSYWGAVVIGEVFLFIEAGIGTYMWIIGLRPGRDIHLLYGSVSLMVLPMVYMFTKGRPGRPEILMYATTFFFGAGLLFRALGTGKDALPSIIPDAFYPLFDTLVQVFSSLPGIFS
jgi:hypothetical protein